MYDKESKTMKDSTTTTEYWNNSNVVLKGKLIDLHPKELVLYIQVDSFVIHNNEAELTVPFNYFDQFDKLIINGINFVKKVERE